MDGDGCDPLASAEGDEGGGVGGRLGAPPPRGRVVAEDLEGGRPDLARPSRGLQQPRAHPQVDADPGCLLTIALLVFFVSLLVIVAALLILPTVTR